MKGDGCESAGGPFVMVPTSIGVSKSGRADFAVLLPSVIKPKTMRNPVLNSCFFKQLAMRKQQNITER